MLEPGYLSKPVRQTNGCVEEEVHGEVFPNSLEHSSLPEHEESEKRPNLVR